MHRSEFLKELKSLFPELREPINREKEELHFEMTVLHVFAQKLIREQNEIELAKVFKLANKAAVQGNNRLKEAIDLSFVEGLNFKGRKSAWEAMPVELQNLYLAFHGKPQV